MAELVLGMLLIVAIVVLFLAVASHGFVRSSAPVKSYPLTLKQRKDALAEANRQFPLQHRLSDLDDCGWDGQ